MTTPMTDHLLSTDRRTQSLPTRDVLTPERLLANQIEATRRQLDEARERLKSDRRRVVQLEEAVAHWERFACELLARRERNGSNSNGH